MITRRQFGMTSTSAGAFATLASTAFGQVDGGLDEKHDHDKSGHGPNGKMQECAKACSDCQRACDSCATHCADMLREGKKEHYDTFMTCQDCADICVAASQSCARGGPFATTICKACAECCAMCAAACEKFPDDKHMTMCAKECRKCEKACREMS